jgi:adenylate cyclase
MEIERKYTLKELPANLDSYPCHLIEQAYLNTKPVVRIRKEDDDYYLTYKGSGMMAREEYDLPLNEESYYHLLEKADGIVITKKRYVLPLSDFQPDNKDNLSIELDIFEGKLAPLIIAEIEFPTEEMADTFTPPDIFAEDVTFNPKYHNSNLSKGI